MKPTFPARTKSKAQAIEECAARVFASRDAAHRHHWMTQSYAQHMALGAFYDDVIEAIDELVECYQGCYGLITPMPAAPVSATDIAGHLETEAGWIEANREGIANGSQACANLVDSLVGVYNRTVYKLRNLA